MGARHAPAKRPDPFSQAAQMNPMRLLIDALRGRKGRRALLAECVRAGHTLATTGLNVAEVYAGLRPNEEAATSAFLDQLNCFDITAEVGRLGGRLKNQWARRGRTLALVDSVIAAAAIEHTCTLMTDNERDFPMPGLQ